jgi:cell wall-associated NlpC family hydrolase
LGGAAVISGIGLAYATAGGVLLWSGIKGETVKQTVAELARGQQPSGTNQQPVDTSAGPAVTSTGGAAGGAQPFVTSSAVANDAQGYAGHAYRYGGAPGPNGTNPWDCSSFCNWVLGHDFGMVLPGNSRPGYDGSTHGPTTLLYLAWGAAAGVSHNPADAQPGDLCVWQTHMGIALGGGQMVSALNERLGTRITSIPGGAPSGEVLYVRRIKSAVGATGTRQAAGTSTAGGRG